MAMQFPKNKQELPKWFEQYIGRGSGKITETALARQIGISQKSISRYVHGESYPSIAIQSKILDAVNELTDSECNSYLYDNDWDLHGKEFSEHYIRSDNEIANRFSRLSRGQQLLISRNPYIKTVSFLEFSFVENVNKLNHKRKTEIISFMENFSLSFNELTKNDQHFTKIRLCLDMIDDINHIKEICGESPQSKDELLIEFTLFSNLSDHEANMAISAASFSAYDWYILKLFATCEIKDTSPHKHILFDEYPDATTYVGELIHSLYSLVTTEEQ